MINMECGDVVIRFVVQTVSTLRDGSSDTNTKDTTARRLVQRESVLSFVSFLQFLNVRFYSTDTATTYIKVAAKC